MSSSSTSTARPASRRWIQLALQVRLSFPHDAQKTLSRAQGSADPYVTLTYSRLEKPLYSTRIIKDDLNPVFEETAVLLVDVNTVKLREKISFQLWDSDRMSVVRRPLTSLAQPPRPNASSRRTT